MVVPSMILFTLFFNPYSSLVLCRCQTTCASAWHAWSTKILFEVAHSLRCDAHLLISQHRGALLKQEWSTLGVRELSVELEWAVLFAHAEI